MSCGVNNFSANIAFARHSRRSQRNRSGRSSCQIIYISKFDGVTTKIALYLYTCTHRLSIFTHITKWFTTNYWWCIGPFSHCLYSWSTVHHCTPVSISSFIFIVRFFFCLFGIEISIVKHKRYWIEEKCKNKERRRLAHTLHRLCRDVCVNFLLKISVQLLICLFVCYFDYTTVAVRLWLLPVVSSINTCCYFLHKAAWWRKYCAFVLWCFIFFFFAFVCCCRW